MESKICQSLVCELEKTVVETESKWPTRKSQHQCPTAAELEQIWWIMMLSHENSFIYDYLDVGLLRKVASMPWDVLFIHNSQCWISAWLLAWVLPFAFDLSQVWSLIFQLILSWGLGHSLSTSPYWKMSEVCFHVFSLGRVVHLFN